MKKYALAGAAIACLASQSFSQSLNELFISHTGADDMEFVEIVGQPNMSLDGMMILVVEGDSTNAGTLDDAIDLTGLTMPADGYFVAGNTAVANLDLDVGSDNVYENGTETFYLISTTDVAGITAMLGTNVDSDLDLVTDIATSSSVTILDIVAMIDGGVAGGTDFTYDSAPIVGPDGTFFPAGIYRGGDFPSTWCDSFLDFGLAADRTPGEANIACPVTGSPGSFCDGSTGNCPCGVSGLPDQGCPNTNPNGNGAKLVMTGTPDLSLTTFGFVISDGADTKPGIIIQGPAAINYPNGNGGIPNASGLFCVNPAQRGGVFITDVNGDATVADFQGNPFAMSAQPAGNTTYYQYWFRDPANACQNAPADSAAFNFSNGIEADWF